MIEKNTIYKVITALRDFAIRFDRGTDERMLLIGSANFMEELIRHYLNASEPGVQSVATLDLYDDAYLDGVSADGLLIGDGCGTIWSKKCPRCGGNNIVVVRVGNAQCQDCMVSQNCCCRLN